MTSSIVPGYPDLVLDQRVWHEGRLFLRGLDRQSGRHNVFALVGRTLVSQLPATHDVRSLFARDACAYTLAGDAIYFCDGADSSIYRCPLGGTPSVLCKAAWRHADIVGDTRHRCLFTRARLTPESSALCAIHVDGSEHALWQSGDEIAALCITHDLGALFWVTRSIGSATLWHAVLDDAGEALRARALCHASDFECIRMLADGRLCALALDRGAARVMLFETSGAACLHR